MEKNRDRWKPIELYCEELQDIIGRMPSCFERYSILVITVVVAVLIIGTYFFKYPDTLDAQIVITNSTPAADVVVRSTGYLEYLCDKNGEYVGKDELLGVVANTANYEDVIWLEDLMGEFERGKMSLAEFIRNLDIRKPMLGDMQHLHIAMCNAAKNLFQHNAYRYYEKKTEVAKIRLQQRGELEKKERAQYKLQEENEKIHHEVFMRDSVLYASGMLSDESYGKARQIYLESQRGPIDRAVKETQHKMQRSNDEESLMDLAHEHFLASQGYEQSFYSSFKDMDATLKNWEKTYVMRSPVDGTVNVMGLFGKDKFVNNGEIVFVVIPQKRENPIGKALLPALGTGKVKKGQRVIVRVDNFPEEEFGSLIGCVNAISETPTSTGNYIVDIAFPHGLETVFHKQLPSSQQFSGTAKLVVKERRLIEIFIQPIKVLLANNV